MKLGLSSEQTCDPSDKCQVNTLLVHKCLKKNNLNGAVHGDMDAMGLDKVLHPYSLQNYKINFGTFD